MKEHLTIGILGTERGVGATHLGIALANYCCSFHHAKTALLEVNPTGEFGRLAEYSESSLLGTGFGNDTSPRRAGIGKDSSLLRTHTDTECGSRILIYGVDYYPSVPLSALSAFYNLDYRYVILDYGAAERERYQDFLRCDRKLIVGSLSPWKKDCYEEFLQAYQPIQQHGGNTVYLALFGYKADLLEFSHQHHLSMRAVPFIANPFQLEKNLFSFLESLI